MKIVRIYLRKRRVCLYGKFTFEQFNNNRNINYLQIEIWTY